MNAPDFSHLYDHHSLITAGETIFEAGDAGDALYVLLEGEVKIILHNHEIDRLSAGDIFGEMALVDAQPRSAGATAVTNCKLVKIDQERFAHLTQQNPQFGLDIMHIMSNRTRRLIDEEIKKLRLEEELAIGRDIQLSLLPKTYPQREGWEFAAVYRAARQVGGDFYDFIQSSHNPDELTLVVADVTGKGVPAALFMASMRAVIRTLRHEERTPAETLALTNQAVIEDTGAALFLSCVVGTLNTQTNQLTLSNAGHEWPLWLKGNQDAVETLHVPGVVLGAFHDIEPQEVRVTLHSGDVLIFYTDGVTEARNGAGDFFGDERLLQTAVSGKHDNAQQLAQRIKTAVETFTQNTPQSDDMTLLVVKRTG